MTLINAQDYYVGRDNNGQLEVNVQYQEKTIFMPVDSMFYMKQHNSDNEMFNC